MPSDGRRAHVSTEHLERMLEGLMVYQKRMAAMNDAAKRELGLRLTRLESAAPMRSMRYVAVVAQSRIARMMMSEVRLSSTRKRPKKPFGNSIDGLRRLETRSDRSSEQHLLGEHA